VFEVIPDDSYRFIGTARLPVTVAVRKTATAGQGTSDGERRD
jgi:hypothetical protein